MHHRNEVTEAIPAIVEGVLKPGNKKQVLHVSYDFGINMDGDYETLDLAMGIHFLIFAPSRSVKVLVCIEKNFLSGALPLENDVVLPWRIQSDHDSCWRTDGFRIFSDLMRAFVYGVGSSIFLDLIPQLKKEGDPDDWYVWKEKDDDIDNRVWVSTNKVEILPIEDVKDIRHMGYNGHEVDFINKYYIEEQS